MPCSNGCGCDIAVRDGRMVGVRGRAADVVNHGRLGPKGLFGSWQWKGRDRLIRPLVREGGQLVETDWDTAMGRIVAHSRADAPPVLQEGVTGARIGAAAPRRRDSGDAAREVVQKCRGDPDAEREQV